MANTDKPRGLDPVAMLDGSQIPEKWFLVDSGNGTNLAVGDPVEIAAAGSVQKIATSGSNVTRVIGVITAIADTNDNPAGHPNSAISTKYLPLSTAGKVKIALAMPDAVFAIQVISGQTPAAADVFSCADLSLAAPDTVTARSTTELAALGAGQAQMKVIGKVNDPSNAYGEHVNLLVTFNESWFSNGVAGI